MYWRIVRRAWIGFILGTAFGFGYVALVPPFTTQAIDTAILLAIVAAGATAGVAADLLMGRRRPAVSEPVSERAVRETVSATS